jgi:hypothetical protein
MLGTAAAGTVVTLDWSDSPGATYYNVQADKDSTSGSVVVLQKPTVSTYTTPALSSGHWYYWRVRACSPAGVQCLDGMVEVQDTVGWVSYGPRDGMVAGRAVGIGIGRLFDLHAAGPIRRTNAECVRPANQGPVIAPLYPGQWAQGRRA